MMQRTADVAGLRPTVNRSIHRHIVCSRLNFGRIAIAAAVTGYVLGGRVAHFEE